MSPSLANLSAAFWYRYHRFPGYLQAKRERFSLQLRRARWLIEDAWQRTFHSWQPLREKTHEEIKQILFRDPTESAEQSRQHVCANLLEQYRGFNIFFLEGRYFGLRRESGDLNLESLRANEYSPCFVGHTVPDVRRDIDRFVPPDNSTSSKAIVEKRRALFIGNLPAEQAAAFLERLQQYEVTVLVTAGPREAWQGYPKIQYLDDSGDESTVIDLDHTSTELLEDLRKRNFDLVVAPFRGRDYWHSFNLERFTPSFARCFIAMFENGKTRSYQGEDLNRVIYNKAYLKEMFRFIPPLKGKRVLEVGCSDGLACDLLLSDDPDMIAGVDSMEAVGCNYPDRRISYFRMDASKLRFKDNVFDVCYSLATLEHVADPFAVMQEMKRVTRPGGYCKVNAAPLYHAPFGHHMFGYFDDYPWIHLRLSKEEIIAYAESHGLDDSIRAERSVSAAEYINGVLTREHLNGLRLEEFRLAEFMSQPDVKVLSFVTSYEGKNLLDESILRELPHISKEDLIISGFDLTFRVR